MEEEISYKAEEKSRSLKPLEVVGIISIFLVGLFLLVYSFRFVERKDDKIFDLELRVDSFKNFLKTHVILLEDSLKKEKKQIQFLEAESNYRLHYLIKEEGPTRNTEEFRGPCKLYTYKEIMDSFEVVENRYHQLLWKR